MKLWKRVAAAAVALGMMVSLTGCLGNFYDKVLTVEDVDFAPGLYLQLQLRAYSEAEGLVENADKDVLKQKVEGVSASKWIQQRTEELARRYVAVQKLAREHGVTLSDDSWSGIESTAQYWAYLEEYYLENGVGYDSWMFQVENSYLDTDLFYYLYGEDGPLYPGEQEMKDAYAEIRTHIRYLSLPLTYSASAEEESAFDDETLAGMVEDTAKAMLAKLQSGTSFEELADGELREVYELLARSYSVDDPADYVYTLYVNPESDSYDEEFRQALVNGSVGDTGYYASETTIMLYEIIPMYENEEDFENQYETILNLIYSEQYDEYLAEIYNSYTVSDVFLARWYHRPGKIS